MHGLRFNIALSAVARILAAAAPLVATNRLVDILGVENYGRWVTLTAVLAWLSVADLGLGYSIRNTFAHYGGANIPPERHTTIAHTVFGAMSLIAILAFFLFGSLCLCVYISATDIVAHNRITLIAMYGVYLLSLPLTVGVAVAQGMQRTGTVQLTQSLCSVGWALALVLLGTHFYGSTIPWQLGLLYGITVALPAFLFSRTVWPLTRFARGYPLSTIAKEGIKLLPLSLRFLALQASSLMLYSMGNIIAYSLFDPVSTARYDVVNKLYFFGLSIFNAILSVYWTEIGVALGRRDRTSLERLWRHVAILSLTCTLCAILSVPIAPTLVRVWTTHAISVDLATVLPFAVLAAVQALAYSGAVFLNAANRLTGQITLSLFAMAGMIPLCMLLAEFHPAGIAIIPIASALLTMPALVFCLYSALRIRKAASHD